MSVLDDRLKDQKDDCHVRGSSGSVLGPVFWNVAHDSLLRMEMPEETYLIVMRNTSSLMAAYELSLTLNKTEAVVLNKKRIPTIFPLRTMTESRDKDGCHIYAAAAGTV